MDIIAPYEPYIRNKTGIWGRGSADAKGPVAAQISAVLELLEDGEIHAGDVALLFVAGEERRHEKC